MANPELAANVFAKGVFGLKKLNAKSSDNLLSRRKSFGTRNLKRGFVKLNSISPSRANHSALYEILKRELYRRHGKESKKLDIHHSRLRAGTLFLDWRFWRMLERRTHNLCKEDPDEARRLGILCANGLSNCAPMDTVTEELRVIMRMPMTEARNELRKLMNSPRFKPFTML